MTKNQTVKKNWISLILWRQLNLIIDFYTVILYVKNLLNYYMDKLYIILSWQFFLVVETGAIN